MMRPDVGSESRRITTARLYRVLEGDDLRSIAENVYGHAAFSVFLLRANLSQIGGGGELRPGQVLFVPRPKGEAREGTHR